MPKSKQQKADIIQNLQDKVANSKSIVFASDHGLSVKVVDNMRRELKKGGGEYLVAKKTLIKKAVDLPEDQLAKLTGSVGIVLSYEDAVVGPKVAHKVAKDHEALSIGAGFLAKEFILEDAVKRLASLPSREVLLAKLVGSINAPVSGFVNVLAGNLRNLVGVLNAIKSKKA